jgi:hypothetical protein
LYLHHDILLRRGSRRPVPFKVVLVLLERCSNAGQIVASGHTVRRISILISECWKRKEKLTKSWETGSGSLKTLSICH